MFSKEPTEVSTIRIDWADWLGARTISTSTWDVPAGITKVSDSTPTTQTTEIELSGGTWGVTYEIPNTITASDADSETRSIIVTIQRFVAYCSLLEVRRRASGGSGSGGSATTTALTNPELEALIEQASRMVDSVCGVAPGYFNPSPIPVATTKTIYGSGTNYLQLEPYIPGSLTVTYPDGYTLPTYYERDGYLIVISGGAGLLLRCSSGWQEGLPIIASAIWGWRETPADVKMATIELVLNLKSETDPNSIKMLSLEGQPLRESLPPRVKEICRRRRAKGVAFV